MSRLATTIRDTLAPLADRLDSGAANAAPTAPARSGAEPDRRGRARYGGAHRARSCDST
ncbi:hypothetical protein [Rhodococcus rhodochrous]|uniref:hypothetical protein n=1 Tax=Rhodococcus rhodochrous TaxID=1829 RepID=UPI000AD8C866|nr:hypothetical protein [Rhodococcus rhodochrous]